jgi:hypothetical protein
MADAAQGHTPAAWTGVTISFVGFIVTGVAVILATAWLVWTGIGLTLAGAVVGKAMQMAGLGKEPRDAAGAH